MKTKVIIFFMGVFLTLPLFAVDAPKPQASQPATADATKAVVTVSEVKPVEAAPAIVAPAAQAPVPPEGMVLVKESEAAPEWLAKAIDAGSQFPIVGKYVVIIAKYLGVIASILTLLVTFLLGMIKVLSPLLNLANLGKLATALAAFQDSKVMYYLKFFSMYNAKKADGPVNKVS